MVQKTTAYLLICGNFIFHMIWEKLFENWFRNESCFNCNWPPYSQLFIMFTYLYSAAPVCILYTMWKFLRVTDTNNSRSSSNTYKTGANEFRVFQFSPFANVVVFLSKFKRMKKRVCTHLPNASYLHTTTTASQYWHCCSSDWLTDASKYTHIHAQAKHIQL